LHRPPETGFAGGFRLLPLFLAVAAAAFFVSCPPKARYVMTPEQLRLLYAERSRPGQAETIEIPFLLDSEIEQYTDKLIGTAVDDREKVRLILEAILSRIHGGVKYTETATQNAVTTFQTGTGNCLSFTNLFIGMARRAGINTVFVAVDEVEDFEWSNGVLVHQKHMCAGFVEHGKLSIVDFVREGAQYWKFKPIADNEAVAHFYNNKGYAEFTKGNIDGAVKKYRTALLMAPEFVPAYNNLAVALNRQGKLDEALETLRTAQRIDSADLSVYSNLAVVLRSKGEAEEAEGALARMEQIKAVSPYNLFVKGRLLRMSGDPVGAEKLLKKAVSREPKNLALRLELAQAYRESGRLDQARRQYERALRIYPLSPEALQALEELNRRPAPDSSS
jgi:tetratricopeptide (TPR) repeat protein